MSVLIFQKFKQSDTSHCGVYLCQCTCAGLFVGRAAAETRILHLLLIVQDQLDPLHAVDAAAALRHQLSLNTHTHNITHNLNLKHSSSVKN